MKKFVMMVAVLFALTACQTKESYVSDFRGFIENVKADAAEYTEQGWEKMDRKFAKFSDELYDKYEAELTSDEKSEIVKLQASYAAIKVKSGMKKAAKKINDALNSLSGKEE